MAEDKRGWLSGLFTYHTIKNFLGTVFPQRGTIRFGSGFEVQDDSNAKETVVTATGGSGGSGGGGDEDLQDAYDLGGAIDADVTGANTLRVRAAGNTADVLLQILRNVGGGEQTLLKAPDSTAIANAGTGLVIAAGGGKAATGSSTASDGGTLYLAGNAGGAAVTGDAGSGGGITQVAGNGGATSGSSGSGYQPGQGGALLRVSGAGGASANGSINGGDAGDITEDTGAPGTNSVDAEGHGGLGGVISYGAVNARGIIIGKLGILEGVKLAGSTIRSGTVNPVGVITGDPGDIFLRVVATNAAIYVHNGASSNNTSWVKLDPSAYLPLAGGTLTGPIKTTQTNTSFSTTPSFDVAANDDFALGTLTANIAITLSNPAVGQSGTIAFLQDGTGSRRITGITVSGFTVRCLNAGGLVNTTEFKAAGARSVLFYKMVTINSVNLCLVQIAGDGAVAPDFT